VVIFHFGNTTFPFNRFPHFFHGGAMAVSYFFVLSGFVLYTAYDEKRIVYADYIKRRFARIVPVYLLALFLYICISYFFSGFSFSVAGVKLIVVHALLLQAYIPDYSMNLNLPGWTLSVEVFFYLVFPLLLVLLKRKTRSFIIMAILLYVCSQAIHLYYYPLRHTLNSNIIDTVFFNPIIHINQFLIGMIGGFLFGKIDAPNNKYRWLLWTTFLTILALMIFLPYNVSCHVGLVAPVFMLFIIGLGVRNPVLLNIKPAVFIGAISYGIYILQLPVFMFFVFINNKYIHIQKQYFFYFFLCMLVLIAAASFTFFEKPLRNKINALNFGAKKPFVG
jgi:peptidoglycan/LPS O-acetylase OafA/YrhL